MTTATTILSFRNMLGFLTSNAMLRLLYTSVGVQWVGCALAVLFKTEKFYDLTGRECIFFLLFKRGREFSQIEMFINLKSERKVILLIFKPII